MASIQDVAKEAKVGVGTVSRVISEKGYVSDKTRKKVLKAIEKLDYTPNELARNLLHNRTNIMAVIIPDISNPFYASLVNEVEKELRENGYKTLLCNTVGDSTNEETYLDMLERNMVDGILTGTHTLDYSHYSRLKKPLVAFDTPPLAEGMPVIAVNHKKGGYLAAQALIQSGCREVVQFKNNNIGAFPFFERHEEFKRVVTEAGIICHEYITEWDKFESNYCTQIAQKCYLEYPNADGVFGTDIIALDYMKCALMNGKKVPEDVKIVAYDGTSILDVVYPSVSVVVQPIKEIAKKCVEQLLNIIAGKEIEGNQIQLDVIFREGMSTNCKKVVTED